MHQLLSFYKKGILVGEKYDQNSSMGHSKNMFERSLRKSSQTCLLFWMKKYILYKFNRAEFARIQDLTALKQYLITQNKKLDSFWKNLISEKLFSEFWTVGRFTVVCNGRWYESYYLFNLYLIKWPEATLCNPFIYLISEALLYREQRMVED